MPNNGGNLISEKDTCNDCGSQVIHQQSFNMYSDYYVFCTNENCKNHEGENVGDQDCMYLEWVKHEK